MFLQPELVAETHLAEWLTLHNEYLQTAISCRLNIVAIRKITARVNEEGATEFILEASNIKHRIKLQFSRFKWWSKFLHICYHIYP
jgi:hypothetical protein